MKDFISAKEASTKAAEYRTNIQDKQLAEIKESILAACEKGEFCIDWHKPISKESIKLLEEAGYIVNSETGRNEYWINIGW